MWILSSLAFYFTYIFVRVMSFSFNILFHDLIVNFNTFICIYLVYNLSFINFGVWVLSLLFCLLAVQLSRS